MGMYDYLIVSTDKLPVSEEEKKIIGDVPGWQTKDFDCILTEVYITDDNKIKINRFNYEPVPKKERPYPEGNGLKGLLGSIKRVNQRLEEIPYTGYVTFYSYIGDDYYEFQAKFTKGILDVIEKVS